MSRPQGHPGCRWARLAVLTGRRSRNPGYEPRSSTTIWPSAARGRSLHTRGPVNDLHRAVRYGPRVSHWRPSSKVFAVLVVLAIAAEISYAVIPEPSLQGNALALLVVIGIVLLVYRGITSQKYADKESR